MTTHLVSGVRISVDVVRVDVEGHQADCLERRRVNCTKQNSLKIKSDNKRDLWACHWWCWCWRSPRLCRHWIQCMALHVQAPVCPKTEESNFSQIIKHFPNVIRGSFCFSLPADDIQHILLVEVVQQLERVSSTNENGLRTPSSTWCPWTWTSQRAN